LYTKSANMAGKEITLKKLPGKRKPPTLTLKLAPAIKPAADSAAHSTKKNKGKKSK
jgi:hypothetical protein